MGYTNKTSHYELPQYVANDKPSWLGDFNAAMLKIDTVMADNDATAEAANSAATGAQTQVASLSAQLSTIQGQVNTAVDTATTADGKATTAQTVASQANTTASEAKTLAETAKQTADNALPIGGGTMTGPLVLSGEPTEDNQAATKGYVDAHSAGVSEMVDITFNDTNVNNYATSRYAKCVKNGSVIMINVESVKGTATTGYSGSSQLFEIFRIPNNIFGIRSSGFTTDYKVLPVGDTMSELAIYAMYESSTNNTVFCVKTTSGTTYTTTSGVCVGVLGMEWL